MKNNSLILVLLIVGFFFFFAGQGETACRNPNLVDGDDSLFVPVAASGFVEIQWFGHSFFQITSSSWNENHHRSIRIHGIPHTPGLASHRNCRQGTPEP